ncbi:glutamate receptor ionotropic, kainate 2-like [Ornithodoros turicata]|uniref:glutamate receptor ionotropic, kainate 2-like n=1 Tax=Ornithodoros turicata TaxID=34597 RepID=UPI00313A3EF9
MVPLHAPALFGFVLAVSLFNVTVARLPETVYIGGLFDGEEEQTQLSFQYALDRINLDISILPSTTIRGLVHHVKPQDSFTASKAMCSFFKQRVSAIIGPTSTAVLNYAKSACTNFNVPHIQTTWEATSNRNPYTLNVYPDPEVLSRAFLDIIKNKHWKSFTLLYEHQDDLILLRHVLNYKLSKKPVVRIAQVNPKLSFRKMLKDIGSKKEFNIVLSIRAERLPQLIREALDVDMMTYYHNYIITSLDIYTLNLTEFKGVQANITALTLLNPERPEVMNVLRDWKIGTELWGVGTHATAPMHLDTATALMYDAVNLLANGLHNTNRLQALDVHSLNCEHPKPWRHGSALLDSMKMITIRGVTGDVRLDERGIRDEFNLDVIELKAKGLIKVGTWHPLSGLKYYENYTQIMEKQFTDELQGHTLRITTVESNPYTMIYPESMNKTGNERFYGYTKDLFELLSQELGFNYEFYRVPDGQYGTPSASGEWNGMVKELLDRKADAAIVDLTITYEREEAVDFTTPFMSTGISILFRKVGKQEPSLFSFLHPFSLDVWFYMLTGYLSVSLFMFIMGRFTPYEWVPQHACVPEDGDLTNQFNLPNSLWFTMGALMQQGSEMAPVAISCRITSGFWSFFVLIMVASYTANLAAFLTAQRMSSPIENANDLAKQSKIKYGCREGGSTCSFFQQSQDPIMKRMWNTMTSELPSPIAKTNEKGVERVLRGDYAYLMEATSIEYEVERNCNLTQVGGLLDNKFYGIATPPLSPVRQALSSAIIKLQERGDLEMLKRRWWRVKGPRCPVESASSSTSEMSLSNVGGVFLVLIFGCIAALLIVVLEFIWKTKKIPYGERDTILRELIKELQLVLSCTGSKENPQAPTDSLSNSVALGSLHQFNYSLNSLKPPH